MISTRSSKELTVEKALDCVYVDSRLERERRNYSAELVRRHISVEDRRGTTIDARER